MSISLLQLSKVLDNSKPNYGLTKDQQEFLEWAAAQDAPIDIEQMFKDMHPDEADNSPTSTESL